MSRAGQINYKGINTQAFAALSLFLQNINRSDFEEIILEGEKLEDFVLVYNSGKRIICESKFRSTGVRFYELKSILETVIKNNKLRKDDELLIISNKFHQNVKSLVNNFVFWTPDNLSGIKNSPPNFTDDQIQIIPQVKLWEVSDDVNREGILFLMYQALGNKNAFWLNKKVLEDWTNTLLVQDIYLKSESGKRKSRADFLNELEEKKNFFLENNGTDIQEVKNTNIRKIEHIVELVAENNPSKRDVCANAITELIANPSLHYETLRRLGQSSQLSLSLWDVLWTASVRGMYSYEIFKIFKNSLSSEDNRNYTVSFVNRVLEEYLVNFHREEHIKNDIVDICEEIFKTDPKYGEEIFEIVKKLYGYSSKIFFYEENKYQDRSWGREQVADFIKRLYQSDKTKPELRQEIISYIFDSFNLVEDDGKYWHFTPPAIFTVVSDYVNESPKERLVIFTKIAIDQYQKSLRRFGKKIKFEGWEHMGSGISQSGSEFTIGDRHFVTKIIQPALELISNDNAKWEYINTNFITRRIEEISFDKPDFLNRCTIPFLFTLYSDSPDLHNNAFDALSDFIKMRKGIPWKVDIIFQELKERKLSPELQWNLIQVSLDEYNNLPVNVFVEQMVTEIAQDNNAGEFQQKAINTLVSWSKDPKYRKNRSMGSYDVIDSVFRLLNNPKTFDYGITILEAHIDSDDFKQSKDTYGSWDVGKALALVISKNVETGISILKRIESSDSLSVNQQLVMLGSLDDLGTDNLQVLETVYREFISPLLMKYSTKPSFESRYSHAYAREGLVKFAELLAKTKSFEFSLEILQRLAEDSDPSLEEHDDENGHNLHERVAAGEDCSEITSVKGNVAWTLRYYSLLPARRFFEQGLDLVEKLSNDDNYYIRLQSTYPLIDFMKNRNTYIDGTEPKERFVSEDVSEKVESIAFNMLRNPENQKLPAVLKGLAHVFSEFRQMNHSQALEVMNVLLSSDSEDVLSDSTSLLVFFAEFRKESYKKWTWGELPDFDDSIFKEIINQQIETGKPAIRHSLGWEFWRLPKENQKETENYNRKLFKISYDYFSKFVVNEYEKDVWGYIYHFIEDYLDYELESCITLWKACVLKEGPYLRNAVSDKGNLDDLYWRPFFYNGKVLVAILKNNGSDEFLKWMEYLLDYPEGLYIANDLEIAVLELSKLPHSSERARVVFDKLVRRYPKYFDIRTAWNNQVKSEESAER